MFKFISNFLHRIFICILQAVNTIREKLIIRERQAEDTAKGQERSILCSYLLNTLFNYSCVQLFNCFISLCTFAVYRWTPTNLLSSSRNTSGHLSRYPRFSFLVFLSSLKALFFSIIHALNSHSFQNDITFALKMSILCCCIYCNFCSIHSEKLVMHI